MVFAAIFDKIKKGLAKTRDLFSGVASLFRLRGRVDKEFLAKLEERLYLADVGTAATGEIVERVRQAFLDKEITGDVEIFVKDQLKALLATPDEGIRYAASGPTVVMIAGVNGSGKATSIAKPLNRHRAGVGRRHRQGRRQLRHEAQARPACEVHRRRREAGRPGAVRARGVRRGVVRGVRGDAEAHGLLPVGLRSTAPSLLHA